MARDSLNVHTIQINVDIPIFLPRQPARNEVSPKLLKSTKIFHSAGPPTDHWPVLDVNHGWNEVSNTTQPWCQQNHDKYGEKTAKKW